MCIRDRHKNGSEIIDVGQRRPGNQRITESLEKTMSVIGICLLYTSDAADERSSVDLGGRRIIKKKYIKKHQHAQTD